MSLDVKKTGGPFNLGLADRWSRDDLRWLVEQGGKINCVGYLHMPLDKINGTVPFGRTDRSKSNLFVNGWKLNTGRHSSVGKRSE